jgi:Excalibur calcium-binding domain
MLKQVQHDVEGTEHLRLNDVRAAGQAPLHGGEPGYAAHLDGDGDGVACEPYY